MKTSIQTDHKFNYALERAATASRIALCVPSGFFLRKAYARHPACRGAAMAETLHSKMANWRTVATRTRSQSSVNVYTGENIKRQAFGQLAIVGSLEGLV